jgi:ATP/ADP translocase
MKERIEKILNVLGWIFIGSGLILGMISYIGIDKEPYKNAKEVYENIPENELAQATYQTALNIYNVQFTYAMSILFGGIVIGLLFIGFAKVIELLKEKSDRDYKMAQMMLKIDGHLSELREKKQ